jgi:hypothetical protein
MGTRADFYVGRGEMAEWIGSVAWDGHPSGFDTPGFFAPCTESEWRAKVQKELADRDDGTTPDQGWPWPWSDSQTTDYAYAWDTDVVYGSAFGCAWFNPLQPEPDDDGPKTVIFPNMKDKQKVTIGKRSGLIVIQMKGGQ